ncbi:MAG: 4Fe-4S dicluster domain-containing protein [Candidatus Omnitrophota bacterium]
MRTYFLETGKLALLYGHIARAYDLFLPVRVEQKKRTVCEFGFDLPCADYQLERYGSAGATPFVFNDYRSLEPTRIFFARPAEEICGYFHGTDNARDAERPVAVTGIKSCDLYAMKIQDFVFLGGNEPDPFYRKRRESALLIAGDCSNFKETCFCRAFDIDPFAREGFDLNMSPVAGGYLIDVISEKGDVVVRAVKELFSDATADQLTARDAARGTVIKKLDEHLAHHRIPKKETLQEIVTAGFASKVFTEQALTCVECGGCVFMCDTCHCFLLADEPEGAAAKRTRVWDGCLYKNFGRVAGGANPLKNRYMRLRNRYIKKFDFFAEQMGIQACCGCGRCIDVCPGKIDIRYILRRLYDEKFPAEAV